MAKIDFAKIAENAQKEIKERELPAGGYVVKIIYVVEMPDKECFKVYYDIAEGEYEGLYCGISTSSFYPGMFFVSYKETAYMYLARFLRLIQESNPAFTLLDEESGLVDTEQIVRPLIGQLIGIVIRKEEYLNKYGEIGIKNAVIEYTNIEQIRTGDYATISAIKRYGEKS